MRQKRVIVLGATGSIGRSTIEVIRHLNGAGDSYRIVGLSCGSRSGQLTALAREFGVRHLAVSNPRGEGPPEPAPASGPADPAQPRTSAGGARAGGASAATGGASAGAGAVWTGEDAPIRLIEETEADIVVNGIAGSPGLRSSLRALELGMDLALANKETVVMAGPIAARIAEERGAAIIPVDSEHSALFHLLSVRDRSTVKRIVITASGGAFRTTPLERFPHLRVEDALAHPTWDMGAKITIDSASMANKGLEVIEAHRLFDMPPEKISVTIHPQSTVHSLIETVEGSYYAQLSEPDMKIPIQNALTYPELRQSPFGGLDLRDLSLTFSEPEAERYPMLSLAYRSIESGGPLPIVYNAANEIAVEAFRAGSIPFTGIAEVVAQTMERSWDGTSPSTAEEVMEVHREAERAAREIVGAREAAV